MSDIETIYKIIQMLPVKTKTGIEKKVIIVSETCPHCNEYLERQDVKEFIKSNDFTKVEFNPFLYCGDCKDGYIIRRISAVDTPTLVDIANLDVENPPTTTAEFAKHLTDLGLRPILGTRKRKKKETTREIEKVEEPTTRKRKKKQEFIKKKQETKNVRKASLGCLEDKCIEM